ncbi:MAG: hypothetical protein PHS49_00660 [Candidatus Gracilibacteria bacterium]|nr:hypothetical protein [Candidatus Gracilibacteria bacterium]
MELVNTHSTILKHKKITSLLSTGYLPSGINSLPFQLKTGHVSVERGYKKITYPGNSPAYAGEATKVVSRKGYFLLFYAV